MIARFKVLLPYSFQVVHSQELTPYRVTLEKYEVTLYPPLQAKIEVLGKEQKEVVLSPLPADPQAPAQRIRVNGEQPIEANLLQIDFKGDDFDRRKMAERDSDPPSSMLFSVANQWLAILRTVLQSPTVRPINEASSFWRVDYFTDVGEPLTSTKELFSMTMMYHHRYHLNVVDKERWDTASKMSLNFEPPIYVGIILDAESVLPDVGSAVMLVSTALETLIESQLGKLASAKGIPGDLWNWITDRGLPLKEPSTEEQFDVLLKILAGKSLKEDPNLWEAFKNVRKARNSFAHSGKAQIGNKAVTTEDAARFVEKGKEIIRWTEKLLEEKERWFSDAKTYQVLLVGPAIPID